MYKNKLSLTNFKELCGYIGFCFFCLSTVFGELISVVIGINGVYFLYLGTIILILISNLYNGKIIINKKSFRYSAGWIIFTIIYVVGYNVMIKHENYFTTCRWIFYFLMIFELSFVPSYRYRNYLKILTNICFVNVFFVLYFWVFPKTYFKMYNIWGYWPTGTDGGQNGYRAGIAAHYSENAMIITIAILIIASFILTEEKKQQRKKLVMIFGVACIALLITSKRAHILFGFSAIIIAYYIYKPQNRFKRFFKIIIGSLISIVILYFASFYIPTINYVFERFSNIGIDQESNTRFSMWSLAINNFLSHPIFGIGWGGYKYEYSEFIFNPMIQAERYAYLNAHNVYLQLLAETGAVGFTIFTVNAINIFRCTIKLLKRRDIQDNSTWKLIIIFSVVMQTFIFMYSITGNCLYDIMFGYYVLAVAISFRMRNNYVYNNTNEVKYK